MKKDRFERLFLWVTIGCLFLSLTLTFNVSAVPATIYVSTTGNDASANPHDIATPFKTLRKALNHSTTGNDDIIIMRGGTYQGAFGSDGLLVNRSLITIEAYPGETPILDGSLVTLAGSGAALLRFSSTVGVCYNNITVDGLTFQNSNQYGVYGMALVNKCDAIVIMNCAFDEIEKNAVYFYSDEAPHIWMYDIVVNNCSFTDIYTGAGSGECVTMLGCYDFSFENNTMGSSTKQLFNCGSSSYGVVKDNSFSNVDYYAMKIDPNNHVAAGHDPTSSHIVIKRNLFNGSGLGSLMLSPEVADDCLDNITVENNVFNIDPLTTYNYGIVIAGHVTNSAGQLFDNILVQYNTIYTSTGADSQCLYLIKRSATFHDIVIVNNVFASAGSTVDQVHFGDLDSTQTYVSMINNLYYSYVLALKGCAFDDVSTWFEADYVTGDPLFTSISTNDLSILDGSACIDAGSSSYTVATDYDGLIERPQNLLYDIGAYEYEYDYHEYFPPTDNPVAPDIIAVIVNLFADVSTPLVLIGIFGFLVVWFYLKVA